MIGDSLQGGLIYRLIMKGHDCGFYIYCLTSVGIVVPDSLVL
jgi:hypothetical protein